MIDANRQPAGRTKRSLLYGADRIAVPSLAHFRTRQAEHLVGNAELEGAQPVIGKHRDMGVPSAHLA